MDVFRVGLPFIVFFMKSVNGFFLANDKLETPGVLTTLAKGDFIFKLIEVWS